MTNRYAVTMLVGDSVYHGVTGGVLYWPGNEIAKGARSMLGRSVTLNHSDDPQDVVGRVISVTGDRGILRGVIELDPSKPKYAVAKGYLDGALAIGATPNVSIDADHRSTLEANRRVARDIQFTALAIVPTGACSDRAGCGVHHAALSKGMTPMSSDTTATAAASTAADAITTNPPATYVPFMPVVSTKLCAGNGGNELAKLADAEATITHLKAKLAQTEQLLDAEKAEKAKLAQALDDEKARAPLVAKLAAALPEFNTDGKTASELKTALEVAQLAPAKVEAGRRTALAATPAPASPKNDFIAQIEAGLGLTN